MILHRLEVQGFRCFASKVALALDGDRINVLFGGNGTGKSSLLWALIRGLFDTHRAGGKGLEALRPWGTDLAPAILIEFEHNGKVFRLRKNFLEGRCAHLEEKQGNKFKPLADNHKAEERVREMLLGDQPKAGLCKPETWGLARVLWCPQEQLAINGFDGPVLCSIQELLGKQALDRDALEVKEGIEEAFSEYWTDRGKPKGGKDTPVWVQRQPEIAEQKQELAVWERELDELQIEQQIAQVLGGERFSMQSRLEAATEVVAQLQSQADKYVPLIALCDKLKAQWDGKRAQAVALESTVKRITEVRERLERSAARLTELDHTIREATANEEGLGRAFDQVHEEFKALDDGDRTIISLERIASDAEDYSQWHQELEEVQLRVTHVENARQRIREVRDRVTGLRAPDQKTLADLERLCGRRLQLQTQLDSALLHVELRPREQRYVEVFQGEPSGVIQLHACGELRVSGSPAIELEVEGFGRIKLTGPAESAAELKEQLGTVVSLIDGFVPRFGSAELAELRQRRQECVTLEGQAANEEKTIKDLLNGRNWESLQADADCLGEKISATEGSHHDWREAPPDPVRLKRELGEKRKRLQDHRSGVTAEWALRQAELAKAQKECSVLRAEWEQVGRQSVDDQAQLSKLRSDGLSDPERSEGLAQLSVEALGLEAKYKRELASLQKAGADPRPGLERAQADRATADAGFQKADQALYQHRGRLKILQDRAPYEQCARIEEKIKQTCDEIGRDQLRADALKLLRETINQCEEEATAGVAAPVAGRASKLLHRIAGKQMGAISLNDALKPWGVGPAETEETIDLETISGGEREQVHLAVRLALAELLTKDAGQRQLVVLDDVLTATDDERLGRVLAILEEMRAHAQFVILTCHPERYKGLKAAKFIDVESLRN